MSTTLKLSKDASGKSVEQTLYRVMVGSLLYLTASRPDISFSVGVCNSDVDWVGNCDDRKSTSGGCFFLGNNLVSWFCKKQKSISLSMAEAEYIATGSGCTQLLWMKQMLVDYEFNQEVSCVKRKLKLVVKDGSSGCKRARNVGRILGLEVDNSGSSIEQIGNKNGYSSVVEATNNLVSPTEEEALEVVLSAI
ncbi:hypothetical protein LWI28_000459 [Acer negundo]|uniref:Gag-pol polyprotein n=1 Tax=Acer negundo TaxID=4023 RepID=A0AAD5IJY2_ACENE|nr:hypothetical protein LWI28_000459 [Acer negundo]